MSIEQEVEKLREMVELLNSNNEKLLKQFEELLERVAKIEGFLVLD